MQEWITVKTGTMLDRHKENPDDELSALVLSLKRMPPGQIVRWYGPDGDKTAAQMIDHLNRHDEVGQWYLSTVKAQGWRPE